MVSTQILLPDAFFAFAVGRLGIETALFKLYQKTIFLALLFKLAHGLFKTVFVGDFNFQHENLNPVE